MLHPENLLRGNYDKLPTLQCVLKIPFKLLCTLHGDVFFGIKSLNAIKYLRGVFPVGGTLHGKHNGRAGKAVDV